MEFRLNSKERLVFEHVKQILSFVFQTLLFLFLAALLLKEFYPEQVKAYVNINLFMIVVIIFGALSIIFPPASNEKDKHKEPNVKDLILIIVLGIIGGAIIFMKIKALGWIGYVISILGGLIIILLSWLVLSEKDETDHSTK